MGNKYMLIGRWQRWLKSSIPLWSSHNFTFLRAAMLCGKFACTLKNMHPKWGENQRRLYLRCNLHQRLRKIKSNFIMSSAARFTVGGLGNKNLQGSEIHLLLTHVYYHENYISVDAVTQATVGWEQREYKLSERSLLLNWVSLPLFVCRRCIKSRSHPRCRFRERILDFSDEVWERGCRVMRF